MADKKEMTDAWEKLGIRPTGIGVVPKILDVAWEMSPRFTICLVGETGIGKTPIVKQWAAERGGYVKTLNFGHMTQEEVSMINFSEMGDSFDFVPPKWMLELNRQAEERGCAVLFLDEWNRGDKALVNALFTLTDERRIHDFELHNDVLVVAAMNPSDGSYLVNEAEKDHAIRKRLNFIYVNHDLRAWLEYTKKSAWHQLVPAFIMSASNFLYDTGARDSGKAFPCPSNWEKVSRILEAAEKAGVEITSSNVHTMVVGQIGTVAGDKFMEFAEDQNTLIQPKEILFNYSSDSKTRKKIASLLGLRINKEGEMENNPKARGTKSATITNLNESLAIEIFANQPEPAKVAECLALYISDLPNELLSTFAAQNIFEQMEHHGAAGKQYFQKLSNHMQASPTYKKKMRVITKAMQDYKLKAGLIKGRDPAK